MILGIGFSSIAEHDGMFEFSMIWSSLVLRKTQSDIDFLIRQGFHTKFCCRNETLAECYDRLGIGYDSSELSGAGSDPAEEEPAIGSEAEAAGDAAEAAVAAELAGDDDETWQQVLEEAHWAQMREDKAYGAAEILADEGVAPSLCSSDKSDDEEEQDGTEESSDQVLEQVLLAQIREDQSSRAAEILADDWDEPAAEARESHQ